MESEIGWLFVELRKLNESCMKLVGCEMKGNRIEVLNFVGWFVTRKPNGIWDFIDWLLNLENQIAVYEIFVDHSWNVVVFKKDCWLEIEQPNELDIGN